MRWYILKALIRKEFARHLANRGGIALAFLLVAAAVLLSVFAPREQAAAGTGMVGGVHHCFIEFDRPTHLVKHLQANVPPELSAQVVFRELKQPEKIDGVVNAETGTGSIQIRHTNEPGRRPTVQISVWHPDGEPGALRRLRTVGVEGEPPRVRARRREEDARREAPGRDPRSTRTTTGSCWKRTSGFRSRSTPRAGPTAAPRRRSRTWSSTAAGWAARCSTSAPRSRPAWWCSRCTSRACTCCRR